MKRLSLSLVLLLTLMSVLPDMSARSPEFVPYSITLQKASKTLKAPQADRYRWFLNDQLLEETSGEIAIDKAGTYKVELINEWGVTTSESIHIAFGIDGDPVVVHLIGDSTVQDYTDYYSPRKGWGQVLQYFFDETNVIINNEAIGGTSSKSFYDNFWAGVLADVDSGDYVFIGFGINDNNPNDPARHTIASTTFKDYLTLYVQETQAAGAYPVIVSTVRRNAWVDDTTVYNAYHGYPIASRELAGALGVPLIDLDAKTKVLMEQLGPDYCGPYWYMNLEAGEYPNSGAYSGGSGDNVHFQEMGAIEMARLVTEEIQASADTNLNSLAPFLRPTYEVTVTASVDTSWDEYRGQITRTASYPEGLNVTLKVKPEEGAEFIKWSTGTLDSLTNKELIQFTMGTEDTSYTAHFVYPPRLVIESPLEGAQYELGQEIILDVFAHLVSDTNTVVTIYDGVDVIATLDSLPYTDTLSTIAVGPGPHTIFAQALDVYGNWLESAPINFEIDYGFPNITLVNPSGDAFYEPGDMISLEVDAYDSDGTVDTVKFYLDDVEVAALFAEPYTYDLANPGVGTYSLYATAKDNNGNVSQTPTVTLGIGPMATIQELETGYCGITDDAGTIDSNHQGFTGAGFVNVANVVGSTINYTIKFPEAGEYQFVFRYASTTARPGDLKVKGDIIGTVDFPARSDWTDWGFSSVIYSVPDTGAIPVSIISTQGSGLPNIDYLRVISLESSESVVASEDCLEQPFGTSVSDPLADAGFSIYPVPAREFLVIESETGQPISEITFYSLDGALVKRIGDVQGTSARISSEGMPSGMYMVRVGIGQKMYVRKVVILQE